MLYFPVMGANEIWRIDLDGGAPEIVATGLGVPDSVKFDSAGHIVSTQVHSGQVLRIDPRTGEQTVLADLNPGLDNLTFVGDRLFVSNFTGEITEILGGGKTQTVLPGGLNWPLDLAVGSDGNLYIADGTYFYAAAARSHAADGGHAVQSGLPGFPARLVPAGPGEFIVTTSGGQVSRYRPARGETECWQTDSISCMAWRSTADGAVVAAELGTGRVLSIRPGHVEVIASGLHDPVGRGDCARRHLPVSEAGAGRVVRLTGSGVHTVVDDLHGRKAFWLSAGSCTS